MTTLAKLFVFHPSPYMVEEIDTLLQRFAPEIEYENIVEADMLDTAMKTGITEELVGRVKQTICAIPKERRAVILCSCSTFGGYAEEMRGYTCHPIVRIDRPMAERAVHSGHRIGLAAALETTIEPTRKLLLSVAADQNKDITIKEIVCKNAWLRRQEKDQEGYIREIVKDIEPAADYLDVIVLAQGSMAPAAEKLQHLPIPVLSSPVLAIERMKELCAQTGRKQPS